MINHSWIKIGKNRLRCTRCGLKKHTVTVKYVSTIYYDLNGIEFINKAPDCLATDIIL